MLSQYLYFSRINDLLVEHVVQLPIGYWVSPPQTAIISSMIVLIIIISLSFTGSIPTALHPYFKMCLVAQGLFPQ